MLGCFSLNLYCLVTLARNTKHADCRKKFELNNIPDYFLNDEYILRQVNDAIGKLKSSVRSQSDIDSVYSDWCGLLKDHMLQNIPHKRIKHTLSNATLHKRHRPGKPWWSEDLSELWAAVCRSEKLWLSSHVHNEKARLNQCIRMLVNNSTVKYRERNVFIGFQSQLCLLTGLQA